jgi:arylsulfatase A-like enzyme
MYAPKKYFDLFPLETLQLPVIKPGDAGDTHYHDVFNDGVKGLRYYRTLGQSYPTIEDGLKAFVQAYLACVAAVDDCIGTVVKAIDESPFKDDTIIVVTSDHGWNNGEKDYLFKNAPWEESTRVPFIVRAPGVTKAGAIAEHPISLIDLYPTLADLCGLEGNTRKNDLGKPLDGHSVRPFLENPASREWAGPDFALSMIFAGEESKTGLTQDDLKIPARQHWSIRTERWRYIRYNNGAEELYDHDADPHEWTNLAGNADQASRLESFRRQLDDLLKHPGDEPVPAKPGDGVWKDAFFKKHPQADTNGDGNLTWPEYKAYKADRDAGQKE